MKKMVKAILILTDEEEVCLLPHEELTAMSILKFIKEKGFLPCENLCDIKDAMRGIGLTGEIDKELARMLTFLIKTGKITLSIRKGQFLHLLPT